MANSKSNLIPTIIYLYSYFLFFIELKGGLNKNNMKKTIIAMCMVFVLIFSVGFMVVSAKNQKHDKEFSLPDNAVEVAPGVFYLGKALDKGKIVEGYAMFVKPTCNNNDICEPGENPSCADCKNSEEDPEDPTEPDTSSCYGFLAKGAKWKTIEPYIVDPANTRGLDNGFIIDNLAMDIDKWETAAGVDILGGGSSTTETLIADTSSPDDKNEVYFADIDDDNVIAVAIIWGYFGGPPPFRELVEWDMVFDDADFDWSADCSSEDCANKMDFENIATHELGHAVGLGDLYNDECSDQTMYGYASKGETKKRDLADGDIAGINALY